MKAFELAWTVLKDASMHGESPFKDAREQALLEAMGNYDPMMQPAPEPEADEPARDFLYDDMTVDEAAEHSRSTAKPFTPPPEKTPQQRAMEELGLHPSELGTSKKERRFMNQVYPEEHKGKNRAGLDFPVVSEGYEGIYDTVNQPFR